MVVKNFGLDLPLLLKLHGIWLVDAHGKSLTLLPPDFRF